VSVPYPPVDGTEPCRTVNPEVFFPGNGLGTEAKKLCAECHVLDECLAFSLAYTVSGVWGGKDGRQRQRIRKEHGIEAVSMDSAFLDRELVLRAHRRGTPYIVIAQQADSTVAAVTSVVAKWRREQAS
jgi:hypothetical protein